MILSVRCTVPDRPGSLGAVAGALARVGASIASLDVVERTDLFAVDEIIVECKVDPEDVARVLSEVPGVVVEAVRPIQDAPDPLAGMQLAADLASRPSFEAKLLAAGIPDALSCTWSIVFSTTDSKAEVVAASAEAPVPAVGLKAPHPTEPRVLEFASWMPPRWRDQELAICPVGPEHFCVVGRPKGLHWRSRELRQLGLLCAFASE